MALPITHATPIGSHMSVPIRMPDGGVYGMFCCVGTKPDCSLHERDLQMMRVFADLAAFEISRDLKSAQAVREKRERIRSVLENEQIQTVYQPIWKLPNVLPIGFECLARFPVEPHRSPDKWFAEAAEVGLGTGARTHRDPHRSLRFATTSAGSLCFGERISRNDFKRRSA